MDINPTPFDGIAMSSKLHSEEAAIPQSALAREVCPDCGGMGSIHHRSACSWCLERSVRITRVRETVRAACSGQRFGSDGGLCWT